MKQWQQRQHRKERKEWGIFISVHLLYLSQVRVLSIKQIQTTFPKTQSLNPTRKICRGVGSSRKVAFIKKKKKIVEKWEKMMMNLIIFQKSKQGFAEKIGEKISQLGSLNLLTQKAPPPSIRCYCLPSIHNLTKLTLD